MRILFLVNELLTVCGVSKHFYHLLAGLKEFYPENEYYVMCGGGDAVEKFRELDIQIYINKKLVHEQRSFNGFVQGIFDIYKFVKTENIDVIHSHHHYAGNMANFVSMISNVKTIITNHGLLPDVGILGHFPSENIIVVNKHIQDDLRENKKFRNKNIILIKHGFFVDETISQKIHSKIQVIAGGRFTEDKGFDTYIKAVSSLRERCNNLDNLTEFYLAGKGPDENRLKELNRELSARIIFLGEIKDFRKKLSDTDIFILPTRSLSEGFPTVFIEAALEKNLIITSDFRGLKDNRMMENVLVFPVEDFKQLSKLFEDSIFNIKKYDSSIEKMYEIIKEEFDLKRMIDSTIALYEKILCSS